LSRGRPFVLIAAVLCSLAALLASLAIDVYGVWQSGLRPDASAYGAMVYLADFLQVQTVLLVVAMAGFVIARQLSGHLDPVRRNPFDLLGLVWHYTTAQGLLGLMLVHGFPRIAG
jgi:cytochrome c oxidase subunit I+III